jgi:hypothetical protein
MIDVWNDSSPVFVYPSFFKTVTKWKVEKYKTTSLHSSVSSTEREITRKESRSLFCICDTVIDCSPPSMILGVDHARGTQKKAMYNA